MKGRLISIAFCIFLAVFLLMAGVGFWYYTIGRKPKLLVSTPIPEKSGMPSSHAVGPNQILLISGGKAILYDTAAGKQQWTTDLAAMPPSTTSAAPVAQQAGISSDKHDPMRQLMEARTSRRSAKLDQWGAQLNARRNNLDTPLKIASFKEEEAKYQKEADEVRKAKVALGISPGPAATAGYGAVPDRRVEFDGSFRYQRREVVRSGPMLVVLQGRSARLVDAANGRLISEVLLAGDLKQAMAGDNCVYVVSSTETGAEHLCRISTRDGSVITANQTGSRRQSGASPTVNAAHNESLIESQRTAFSAAGNRLVQLDVRLVEKKITERKALKGDSASDWEAADKNTTGGWSNDAGAFAQAIANDNQREQTGGVDLVDDSIYEIVLRHPFDAEVPESAPIKVQGRPNVFSTPSFDLVTAGRSLLVFDRKNKKVWETTLAFPVVPTGFAMEYDSGRPGTPAQPCLEDDKRLYFFDQGFLNAFDRNTGRTLWRLPSVGINKIQLDPGGMFDSGPVLYVTSANESPEKLQYSQQAGRAPLPLIFKLDASTGKVLWKVDKYQDCFVSAGNVYATMETRNAEDMVNSVFQRSKAISTRFKLYKLSARNGQAQWEWFQARKPLCIAPDRKKVSLLFADELQILTSRAL